MPDEDPLLGTARWVAPLLWEEFVEEELRLEAVDPELRVEDARLEELLEDALLELEESDDWLRLEAVWPLLERVEEALPSDEATDGSGPVSTATRIANAESASRLP